MLGRVTPNSMVSSSLLKRSIGLETEYAVIFRAAEGVQSFPSRRMVYQSICDAISAEQPTAPGRFGTSQLFLANGGAVSHENSVANDSLPGGLVEGATPEVSSPETLLNCQRAQDRMFRRAAEKCKVDRPIRLLKNSCDAVGHVYGCQENYEATVASGLRLFCFRVGILALLPLQAVYMLVVFVLFATAGTVVALGTYLKRFFAGGSAGEERVSGQLPPPILGMLVFALRLVQTPLVFLLTLLIRAFVFRPQRRHLSAFLASRIALTGSGYVDRKGKFWLSPKALAIDCMTAMGGYRGERPVFVFGHWLEQMCGQTFFGLDAMKRLLQRRQRLQIGLSDSNISDTAEYLKVATTCLVLDMIESDGPLQSLPRLRHPLKALLTLTRDWHLIARVPTTRGPMSALEIQTCYLRACRAFVASQGEAAPAESHRILSLWEETLDALWSYRVDPRQIVPLLGRVDWATKRWMLDQLSPSAPWEVRKKVDLKYHELSDDGYAAKVALVDGSVHLTDEGQIERAGRLAPGESRASRRGHWIREFGGSEQTLRVSWSHVVVGKGQDRRVFALDRAEE